MSNTFSWLEDSDLIRYFPNVILPAITDTLTMVVVSGILSIIFGIIFGVILFLSKPYGLMPMPIVHKIIGFISDIVRAFPTMILIVALVPITRMVIGKTIGVPAAIFALTIGCTPFAIRMAENALNTVDIDTINAAKVFGATRMQIVTKVLLPESKANLISNYTIMLINLLNMTTIAGAVGAGGLGAVALTYGYQRFDYQIMYAVVLILIVIVLVIQQAGKALYKMNK